MNKEINISILSDVIANKIIAFCNLNVNKEKNNCKYYFGSIR